MKSIPGGVHGSRGYKDMEMGLGNMSYPRLHHRACARPIILRDVDDLSINGIAMERGNH